MNIKTLIIILAAALPFASCQHATTSESQVTTQLPFARGLQNALDFAVKSSNGTGVSAAIVIQGQGAWTGASGYSDSATQITPNMLFDIGSIGKNYLAALVLQLAEEQALSLDDPISRWLPDYPHIDNTVTIRQLLNHTSGIFDWVEHPRSPFRIPFEDIDFEEASSPEEMLTSLVDEPYFSPGRGWHYSTTNYILLRMIVERVTQSSISEELQLRFLGPLDLSHTVVLDSGIRPGRDFNAAHAWWDVDGDGILDDISSRSTTWMTTRSPAMMYATAEDLARWSQAFHSGELLSQASIDRMVDFHYPATGEPYSGFGLGTGVFRLWGLEFWGHLGWQYGYTAAMLYLPGNSTSFAVLANDNNMASMYSAALALLAIAGLHISPMGFISVAAIILLLISTLLWPVGWLVNLFRKQAVLPGKGIPIRPRFARPSRIVAIIVMITFFAVATLYALYSLDPQGPLSWKGGTTIARAILFLLIASSGLSISLIVFSFLAWKDRYWSLCGRIHYTLVVLAAMTGVSSFLAQIF
ncbi:MAG: beta-lactamase family protein [Fidelibacterota bacterium]|nr:MAG: beta-lactamase family protein [Candidatus Neomarinimicrobiota bacterium]